MILLDTNVLSEALRPEPSAVVVRWLNRHFAESAISAITVFELMAGAATLPRGKRRDTLENAIARTIQRFGPRIYAFDRAAAASAAQLIAAARAKGHPLHRGGDKLADLQIAGICLAYGLQLATRNVADFKGLGFNVIDPWAG